MVANENLLAVETAVAERLSISARHAQSLQIAIGQ